MAESVVVKEDYRKRVRSDADAFARLNGWKRAPKEFTLRRLAGMRPGPRHDEDAMPIHISDRDPHRVLDHCDFFLLGGNPVAIVTMPYGAEMEHAREMANRYGLEVQAPPIDKSGWWLPGHSRCFVFTRFGMVVRWLPQQTTTTSAAELAAAGSAGL